MVTMYFLAVFTSSNTTQYIPHELPLFVTLESCEKTAKALDGTIPTNSNVKCLPIEVSKEIK